MLFAWPPAIAVSSAGGKESAEDAMLGVEDRQMLIGDGLHPLRANGSGQRGDLRGVEIVRGREPRQTQFKIRFGSQSVGGIEAEIADQRLAGVSFAQSVENAGGANENRALRLTRKSTMRLSPGFRMRGLATRTCMPGRLHTFHGRAQSVKIQIIQSDASGLGGDGGVHLFGTADQQYGFERPRPQAGAFRAAGRAWG